MSQGLRVLVLPHTEANWLANSISYEAISGQFALSIPCLRECSGAGVGVVAHRGPGIGHPQGIRRAAAAGGLAGGTGPSRRRGEPAAAGDARRAHRRGGMPARGAAGALRLTSGRFVHAGLSRPKGSL